MNPETGRAALQMALFITVVSGGLVLFEPPGTAEYLISLAALAIGLTFLGLVLILIRRAHH